MSSTSDWKPSWLVAAIVLMCLSSEWVHITLSGPRFTGTDVPTTLGIVLLGPVPALSAGLVAVAFDTWWRRVPTRVALCNAAVASGACAASAGVFEFAAWRGWVEPSDSSLLLVVLLVAFTLNVTDALLLWFTSPFGLGQTVRGALLPVLPWIFAGAAIAAGTAHTYYSLGQGVVLGTAVLLLVIMLLLRAVEGEHRRAHEAQIFELERRQMETEVQLTSERERGRLLLEMHDDVLQSLLAAEQDVEAALEGDRESLVYGRNGLREGIRTLRALLTEGGGRTHASATRLQSALERLDRIGVRYEVDLEAVEGSPLKPLVLDLAAEVTNNCAKHSRATRLLLRAERNVDGLKVFASDDGVGFDHHAALKGGRGFGLRSVLDRVAATDGEMKVDSTNNGTSIAFTWTAGALERVDRSNEE